MQNAFQSTALSSLPFLAARQAIATPPLPYRRVQTLCTDPQFIAALHAYRGSGGLAPAEELLTSYRRHCGHDLATLARWIVARQVISFAWQARTWIPLFQFCPHDMTPRRDLAPVLATLNAVCDEWELASWFTQPNPWLAGCTPVAAVASDLPAVLLAARAVQPGPSRSLRPQPGGYCGAPV